MIKQSSVTSRRDVASTVGCSLPWDVRLTHRPLSFCTVNHCSVSVSSSKRRPFCCRHSPGDTKPTEAPEPSGPGDGELGRDCASAPWDGSAFQGPTAPRFLITVGSRQLSSWPQGGGQWPAETCLEQLQVGCRQWVRS